MWGAVTTIPDRARPYGAKAESALVTLARLLKPLGGKKLSGFFAGGFIEQHAALTDLVDVPYMELEIVGEIKCYCRKKEQKFHQLTATSKNY